MDLEEVKKIIKYELGYDSYIKGVEYPKINISLMDLNRYLDNSKIYSFYVRSESYYAYYDVKVRIKNNEILRFSCSCPQFSNNHTCKHIAASILKYYNSIFEEPKDSFTITNKFLDLFKEEKKEKNIKEKLKLEIELDLDENSYRLFIGTSKTYVVKSETKFNDFMEAYRKGGTYIFGTKFIFDSSKHYFDSDDEWLINFLNKKDDDYYNYRRNIFSLSEREIEILLDKLKDKKFKVKDYGIVNKIQYGVPTNLNLKLVDNNYKLEVENFDKYIQFNDYKYVIYDSILYVIPETYIKLFQTLNDNELEYLNFKKDKVDVFKNGFLKKVKDNIKISEEIDDIVVSGKPDISLYFDFQSDKIKCNIKLKYQDVTIDYFDKNNNIIRDEEAESKVIEDLLDQKFLLGKQILLTEVDDIGEFLADGLSKLKEKYDIYTSKKMDNINIIKKSNVKSNFSIGQDGIMSYKFNVDNIDLSEVDNVLKSLRANKRYYKLKNGNFIDLEDESLKELSGIANDLELNNLKSGDIQIPKYRAFYIESLKNNKYKSINTSSSFDNFIDNFKKYQNLELCLNEKDEKILRNYQKEGVKWLYTLYKCDLGGILADEMGLGKSIQTICFIKQIIKENADAKIIIVCPTALVYNWVHEFDKFGNELRYVAVAESKEKRKEIINNFDKYNIFITSYGLVRNDNDEYEDKSFELCVIDEAQTIKNYEAGLTKEVKKIKARTKIALTGTPLENSVIELWSIFDFILPGYLNSLMKFREKYGIKDVDEESLSKLSLLNYQIKPFILRRKKKEVSKDLPDKIENNVYLELPEIQKKIYVKELNDTRKEMDELILESGYTKARFKILTLLTKLRQLCIDPSVVYKNYKYDSIKIEKLIEIVKDYIADGHKIVIFSSFKRILDNVKNRFDKEKISYYMIDGEVKGKVRTELVDKFNTDNTNCFLITLKSGGVGLNLTSADIVIHLDIWWNPQAENQATDRTHRIGQKNKVTVIRLITKGTIEERILELQNKKRILSDNLIEGKDNSTLINTITEEELNSLLTLGNDEG